MQRHFPKKQPLGLALLATATLSLMAHAPQAAPTGLGMAVTPQPTSSKLASYDLAIYIENLLKPTTPQGHGIAEGPIQEANKQVNFRVASKELGVGQN